MLRFKQLSTKRIRGYFVIAVCSGLVLFLPGSFALAETIGVGVGTGKIEVSEKIKPSLDYNLPSIAVFNKGDVESRYEMTVQYNETQPELKPPADWITFSPQEFALEPGKAQQVEITLNPNYSAKPGKYFAYLEARPLKKDQNGNSSVSVAAATKFSFEIVPANFWMRIYYSLLAFWIQYKTIIIPAGAALIIAALVLLARKHLNIQVQRKKPEKKKDDSPSNNSEN